MITQILKFFKNIGQAKKIRITQCSNKYAWYNNMTGREFEVTGIYRDIGYEVQYNGETNFYFILYEDCEVVK